MDHLYVYKREVFLTIVSTYLVKYSIFIQFIYFDYFKNHSREDKI